MGRGITLTDIYNINQLQAMRIAHAAWHDVNTTTIQNCWCKAGILPEVESSSCTIHPLIPISARDWHGLGKPLGFLKGMGMDWIRV